MADSVKNKYYFRLYFLKKETFGRGTPLRLTMRMRIEKHPLGLGLPLCKVS